MDIKLFLIAPANIITGNSIKYLIALMNFVVFI